MEPSEIPIQLYNYFLLTFMSLRRPDIAIDVWNHMISSGRKPEQASWGAMLHGCRRARDLKSMELVWAKMRAAGVKPDVRSWTIRIGGLLHSRKWDLGIRALEEMGDTWKEAVRQGHDMTRLPNTSKDLSAIGDIDGIIKPTTATINTVLAGLIKTGKGELAPEILEWAKSLGILPDIVTFNTMLRPAVRDGKSGEASNLLQQMESLNIKPDVVTFTVILEGLFHANALASSAASPVEQQTAITDVLTQMEESGIQANAWSYGTILDNLLKTSTPNLPAARAVLEHMASRNLKPSPQVYTILVSHYFSQNPPDLAALEALWNRIKFERGVVDLIFYDRMLEGYGRLGDVSTAMMFLRIMAKEGKAPGWWALIVVLRAVAHAEEWDIARDLINDVERTDGLFHTGMGGQRGEVEFRQLVDDLREQGLVEPPSSLTNPHAEASGPEVIAS